MKVLVIGSGGREHALCWKIRQSPAVEKLYCAPGNAGIGAIAECVSIKVEDFEALAAFVKEKKVDLTVVGPEVPLAAGIVDFFNEKGFAIFGPNKKASQLEASKVFSKDFMKKHGVPTAGYHAFSDFAKSLEFLATQPKHRRLVVKADGLAAGKGVIICNTTDEARAAIAEIMEDKVFGAAGKEVVIEEFLEGEEVSVQIFLDGKHYQIMAAAQDHKRVNDNDQGPNTGGMGAYAPAPIMDETLRVKVEGQVIAPIMEGLQKEGIDYKGVLYIGLMIVKGEPYVLEFNCRFGDPETQVVLPLLKSDLLEIISRINRTELDKIKIEWYNKAAVCVVLASGGYPGNYEKGREINGLEEAGKLAEVIVFHAGTALNGAKKYVTAGGRVLGVTGLGIDIREAISTAYEAAGKISFEGMHCRKDIGKRALQRL